MRVVVFATLLLGAAGAAADAGEVSAAVAANFTKPAEALATAFTAQTGHTVQFSFGATGALYAQITQGAPFEVFLSADAKHPALSVIDGQGVDGTIFTYAVGKVVLYSPSVDVTDGEAILRAGAFHHIAIADPRTAPYGAAALEVLAKLGLADARAPRIVTGENISQALQFVDSGNAELGFAALSQVSDKPAANVWRVPKADYSPILQNAVLLKPGESDATARAFLQFLKTDDARAIIESFGYDVEATQ